MKNKVLKIGLVVLVILSMTISNFIFVGKTFFSYAADDISTNHNNVKFGVYFKNEKGEHVPVLEKQPTDTDLKLYLQLQVQREGYFNGNIKLEKSNFKISKIENPYVNNVDGNTINLNRISQGENIELEVSIEPLKEDIFDLGLLDMQSEITLEGTYHDSTEKDIKINANKKVQLNLVSNINKENVVSEMDVITNRIIKVDNEDARVIQMRVKLGLLDNTYPIKSIHSEISIPNIGDKEPQIVLNANLNNMKNYKYETKNQKLLIDLNNEDEKVSWKKQGQEEIIISYIYDKDASVEESKVTLTQKLTLGDKSEVKADDVMITLNNEEKDSIIGIQSKNAEESIYKGKLYAGINRKIATKTTVEINLVKAVNEVRVVENASNYETQINENLIDSNTYYVQTYINKSKFDEMLGNEDSKIKIYSGSKLIATIDKNAQANEEGNIVINYEESKVKTIEIIIENPTKEGKIEFTHVKNVASREKEIIKQANKISTQISGKYNQTLENLEPIELQSDIELQDTSTYATLEADKESLSTVIANDIEMRAVLNTAEEKYDLYENPVVKVILPDGVENISINNINILYDEELKIVNYVVEGNVITIELQGKQTMYAQGSLEGATIVINANVVLDRKLSTQDSKITMIYSNQNAESYANALEEGNAEIPIKIVAPTDLITIYSVDELQVETVEPNEEEKVFLEKQTGEKEITPEIEIVNSKENNIKDIKVIGDFPTDGAQNNAGIKLTRGIEIPEKEGVKVYYTENEKANTNLSNEENGWEENIQDISKAKKYLITIDELKNQEGVIANYKAEIPEGLDYNQGANIAYDVEFTDGISNMQSEAKSSVINMTTGEGASAKLEVSASVGNTQLKNGDTVRAGEVIKYHLTVTNVGTEDIKEGVLEAPIPEGTVYVEPKPYYEYTGSGYYKEIEKDNYSAKIQDLKVGDKVETEYEVRVKKDIADNKAIEYSYKVSYNDIKKESEKISVNAERGDIRVSLKRVTDREIEIKPLGTISYYLIVENMSETKKDDVKVKSFIPEQMKVQSASILTGYEDIDIKDENIRDDEVTGKYIDVPRNENTKEEKIEYSEEINIGSLNAGENKILYYSILIGNIISTTSLDVYSVVKDGEEEYRSNVWRQVVNNYDVDITMTSNVEEKYIEVENMIEYSINLKNNKDESIYALEMIDELPSELAIQKITVDGEEKNVTKNSINLSIDLEGNKEADIKILAKVDNMELTEPRQIENQAEARILSETVAQTDKIVHVIEANAEPEPDDSTYPDAPTNPDDVPPPSVQNNPNNPNNPSDSDNPSNPTNPNTPSNPTNPENTQTKSITGVAWYDANENGKKDLSEEKLKGIKVSVLNVETNQLVKNVQAVTDDTGTYLLNNIGKGKYMLIFDYDKTQYGLTEYKAKDVTERENSDVIKNQLVIEKETKEVAATDVIQIEDDNIDGVNIGLVKLKDFDLKLEKYISKVIVQNTSGTTVREYENTNLAKVEIDAKLLKNTNVVVEYKIKVSNVGEVEGYAKNIVDYLPADFKFSSEMNKDWYQSGNSLYNTSLANEKISAGQTKEITLTVTKAMTENNTGRVSNTAEIAEDYNELGLKDLNSTPANRADGENDISSADLLISIKTGKILYYSIIIFSIIAILSVAVIVVKKQRNKNEKKIEKI